MSVVLVMGVSGSGKTTVGTALAAKLGARFEDADAYHPAANVEKMRRGVPLDEADRAPWLAALAAKVREWAPRSDVTVLACSALKAAHRQVLTGGDPRVKVVYLKVPREVLELRLAARIGHFFDASLLPSQLAALEAPLGALVLDAAQPVEALVEEIAAVLSARVS